MLLALSMVSFTDCLPYKSSPGAGSFVGGAASSNDSTASPLPGTLVFFASARFKAIASLMLRGGGGGGKSSTLVFGTGFVVDFVRNLGVGVGVGLNVDVVRVLAAGATGVRALAGVVGDFAGFVCVRDEGTGTRDIVIVNEDS